MSPSHKTDHCAEKLLRVCRRNVSRPRQFFSEEWIKADFSRSSYDAIVVGAGLGGLLAAAYVARQGGRVLVLERLRYIGGRFTTVQQDGCAITTGALHMAPHGAGGPLARAIRELGLPFELVPSDVSFYFRGQHVEWTRPWDVMRLFTPRGRIDMLKVTTLLSAPFASKQAEEQPFSEWLARQTSDAAIHLFFQSFVQFAVSVLASQISFGEMRAIHQSVLRYGMPAIPVGGCTRIVDSLAEFIRARGGEIQTSVEVQRICTNNSVNSVEFRNRHTGDSGRIRSSLVISDTGPHATRAMLNSEGQRAIGEFSEMESAAGLKLHLVSDRSLIAHNGIMLCLDTRRISGMVEVSRAVPEVVPPGLHMIDTFQVMRTDNLAEERDLALADLRDMFGDEAVSHCRVLRASAFRSRWPVNHARQGFDLSDQEPIPGLVMVGDAYKPRGHIMAEGVAAGVRRVSPRLHLSNQAELNRNAPC
ncbi:MAG TPA: FAD-dependent oxidoreductase [Chloroflexota bacterium]